MLIFNSSKSHSTKRVKHGKPRKRQNRKTLQAQEDVAMRAGLEEYLEYGNYEIKEDSGKKIRAKKKAQAEKGVSKASGAKGSKVKKRLANIGSLGSRLSIADGANADRPALGIDNARTKNMALKALLAGVPLEGQREARSDRANIIRASRLLGFRRVSPDGLGAWKLKGNLPTYHNSWAFAYYRRRHGYSFIQSPSHCLGIHGKLYHQTFESPQLMIQSVSGRRALVCHLEVC